MSIRPVDRATVHAADAGRIRGRVSAGADADRPGPPEPGAAEAALSHRATGAAAIDVRYSHPVSGRTGPPGRRPFHELENAPLTPHTSGITRRTSTSRAAGFAADISGPAAGEPLHDVVAVAR